MGPRIADPITKNKTTLFSYEYQRFGVVPKFDLIEFFRVVIERPCKNRIIGRRFLQVLDFALRGGDGPAILYDVNLNLIGWTIPFSFIVAGGKLG